MTEMVSSPRRMRSRENFVASTGDRTLMSRPSVSCCGRYSLTLAISCASWARFSSSQKTAGAPVARARVTASLTQSWMGRSLVWQARKMSPSATSCSRTTLPSESTRRTVPACASSKVLSWEPYSSAFCAMRPTFGTEPMVDGSKAPLARQSSMTTWYTPE